MARFYRIPIIVLGLFWICPAEVSAQVAINEVLPNPEGADVGSEWVELYNNDQEVATLKNCVLYLHGTNNNQKVEFGEDDFVEKYKVISWDGSWLNNDGDTIRLVCEAISESVSYGDAAGSVITKPGEAVSFGRTPDGSGIFTILSSLTMGYANSPPLTNTPKPTNLPSATPKPTASVVPTKNSPTLPVGEKSQIPKVIEGISQTPAVYANQTPAESENITGSATDEAKHKETSEIDDSAEAQILSARTESSFPFLAYIFIIPGILILSFFLFTVIRSYKKRYN